MRDKKDEWYDNVRDWERRTRRPINKLYVTVRLAGGPDPQPLMSFTVTFSKLMSNPLFMMYFIHYFFGVWLSSCSFNFLGSFELQKMKALKLIGHNYTVYWFVVHYSSFWKCVTYKCYTLSQYVLYLVQITTIGCEVPISLFDNRAVVCHGNCLDLNKQLFILYTVFPVRLQLLLQNLILPTLFIDAITLPLSKTNVVQTVLVKINPINICLFVNFANQNKCVHNSVLIFTTAV